MCSKWTIDKMHILSDFVWESDGWENEEFNVDEEKKNLEVTLFFRVHCFEPCTKKNDIIDRAKRNGPNNTHTKQREKEKKINGTENNLFVYYI